MSHNPSPLPETAHRLIITRSFAAPRELVWLAWTRPESLGEWFKPETDFKTCTVRADVKVGGKYRIQMQAADGEYFTVAGTYREIRRPERLVFTWAWEKDGSEADFGELDGTESLVTLEFHARGDQTELVLTHEQLASAQSRDKHVQGWGGCLEQLAGRFAKSQPFVIERTFAAPVGLVWEAITSKEAMKEWYFDLEEFKTEVGFEFGFTVEHKGMQYCHQCRVTEVIPQKRLAYTWRYEGHPGDSLVTFDLFAEGPNTRLKLTHIGLESFPPLPEFGRENFAQGWTQLIGTGLKEFVETGGPAA